MRRRHAAVTSRTRAAPSTSGLNLAQPYVRPFGSGQNLGAIDPAQDPAAAISAAC